MDLMEAIYNRRAIRNYADFKVPSKTLYGLIMAAVQAPSAMNQQPWAFAVFQGKKQLKNFSDRAKKHYLTLPEAKSLPPELRQRLNDPAWNMFYNAETLILICARPECLNPAEDCCLAAENLMLAAYGMGLGTCPIGLARPWLNMPEVKAELAIPKVYAVVFPLILGRPGEERLPAGSRKTPQFLNWQ